MLRSRGSIALAWFLFAAVCIMAVINAVLLPIQSGRVITRVGETFFALIPIFFALPAALIVTHQRRNPIGWLLMIHPLVTIPSDMCARYLLTFRAGPPPPTVQNLLMIWFYDISWMALIFPILLVLFFFPTGRLLSPRWRWTVYLTIGMTIFLMFFTAFARDIRPTFASWMLRNPVGFIPSDIMDAILLPWALHLAVLTVAGVTAVVVRFRRGSIVERQQLKWLLYACFLFGAIYISLVFRNMNTNQWESADLSTLLFPLALTAMPAAITIAILRYRLFDIDVIIRRTLQYTLLTLLLVLVYFGSVVLLQLALGAVFSQVEDLAVVLSTLAIAALFTPLRRRVQSFIDRRFFRSKYDADKILTSFISASKSVLTMELLTQELIIVVDETMHPEQTSLWLRTTPTNDPVK